MKSLINSQGLLIMEPSKFYEGLYTSSRMDRSQGDTFFERCDIPQLNNEQKQFLKNPLTLGEISRALKDMANDKSPGLDRFTANFYDFLG